MILRVLLLIGIGCAARGIDPPVIESGSLPAPRPEDHRLRIATANMWGVAVLGFDWADDIDERFAAMAERLSDNEPMLDVVLIQEAWKDSARRALLDHPGVVRNFPYRVDTVEQPGGAGLVTLSRIPIEAADFHRFRAQGRCMKFWEGDCLSGKGILSVRLSVRGHSFWVGNTHLIACYSRADEPEDACDVEDPNGADRWDQILEAREMIERLIGHHPAVLGGDFNMTRTSRYYPAMTSGAIPSHPSDEPPSSRAPHADRGWIEPGENMAGANRLDYLWTRAGRELRWHAPKSVQRIFSEPVALRSGKSVPLSDHPVLLTQLCLVRAEDPTNQCLPLDSDSRIED